MNEESQETTGHLEMIKGTNPCIRYDVYRRNAPSIRSRPFVKKYKKLARVNVMKRKGTSFEKIA